MSIIERMADSLIGFVLLICLGFGAIAAAVIFATVAYSWAIDRPACYAYGVVSQQSVFWSIGTNCIVKQDGNWVDFQVATHRKQEITIKQR